MLEERRRTKNHGGWPTLHGLAPELLNVEWRSKPADGAATRRRDDGRRHCELVILVPGPPDGSPHVEEVSVEVLYTQRLARRTEYALRIVPVDGPAPCLGCGGQGLAVHDPVGIVLRMAVLDSSANRGWKRRALAKGDTKDMGETGIRGTAIATASKARAACLSADTRTRSTSSTA